MKIGIVGEGKMGSGIFSYLVDFPMQLVWLCSAQADCEKLSKQFLRRIKRSLDTGIIDPERYEVLAASTISSDMHSLKDCDLIIEAINEHADLKRDLFAILDGIVKPGALFASNSSSINPSEIAPSGPRAANIVGLHFFYPVALKNIVEITVTKDLSTAALSSVESFLIAIGRRYIILDEENSFILNRIYLDVQNEAFHLVNTGQCTVRQMDQLVKKHLFPFGVFDFCDSVGIDTMLAAIKNYTRDYTHRGWFEPFILKLETLVSEGKLGVKSNSGFYTYPMDPDSVPLPSDSPEIVHHLHSTWLSSCKRFTALAHIPIDDANHAIREYFDIDRGPFG